MKKRPVLLALTMMGLLLGNIPFSHAQTIGPPEPRKRPEPAAVKPLDQVKGSFMRLFKKEEAATDLTQPMAKTKKLKARSLRQMQKSLPKRLKNPS